MYGEAGIITLARIKRENVHVDWKLHTYLNYVTVCANGRDVLFPRRIINANGRRCSEIYQIAYNGSVTIDCREDDVSELVIDPVQIVPIRVCQLFDCYNLRFSVHNDQNAACSRTGYPPLHWGNSEMSLLSARCDVLHYCIYCS